jgi:hypothetical protein
MEVKPSQAGEKGQHYSNCYSELVPASNEFKALGDPEIVDPELDSGRGSG